VFLYRIFFFFFFLNSVWVFWCLLIFLEIWSLLVRSSAVYLRSIDCYCAQAHIGQKVMQCGCVIKRTSKMFYFFLNPDRCSSAVRGRSSVVHFCDQSHLYCDRAHLQIATFFMLAPLSAVITNKPEAAKY
jgi:hypothetical protein